MLIDAIRGIMRGEGVDFPSLVMQLPRDSGRYFSDSPAA